MIIEPRSAGCAMEASGNHPLSTESCGPKVNIAIQDSDEEDNEVLPPGK
jgi:hypothetical protein